MPLRQRRHLALQPCDLWIGRAAAVPQIVVVHGVHGIHASAPSRSRSCFMPRWRFTRTDAGVRPVRAAISGPVIPSTSRSTSVSRYASGNVRMTASAASASVRSGSVRPTSSVRGLNGLRSAAQVIGRPVARDGRQPAAECLRIAQCPHRPPPPDLPQRASRPRAPANGRLPADAPAAGDQPARCRSNRSTARWPATACSSSRCRTPTRTTPDPADLRHVGTIAAIRQMAKGPERRPPHHRRRPDARARRARHQERRVAARHGRAAPGAGRAHARSRRATSGGCRS